MRCDYKTRGVLMNHPEKFKEYKVIIKDEIK